MCEQRSFSANVVDSDVAVARLREARQGLAGFAESAPPAARVLGVIDFFLGGSSPDQLRPNVVEEYHATRRWLSQAYFPPDRAVLVRLASQDHGMLNLDMESAGEWFLLSLRTAEVEQPAGYVEPQVALSGIDEGQDYFLEELLTGVIYPVELDRPYPGSYLAGKTDQRGDPAGAERCRVLPGRCQGDFQLFQLVGANGTDGQIEGLFGPVQSAVSNTRISDRAAGQRQHQLAKNPDCGVGVAADVVSGPPLSGEPGQVLIVAFPDANNGLMLQDRHEEAAYRLDQLDVVTRGDDQRGVVFRVTSEVSGAKFIRSRIVLESVRCIRQEDSLQERGQRARLFREFFRSIESLPGDLLVSLRRQGVSLGRMGLANRLGLAEGKKSLLELLHSAWN